jgi:hypothetical protein
MGRTQRGNNNAYCQDNEVSWVNWTLTPAERQLLEFTRALIVIRHAHQVLRRRRYFDGHGHNGDKDVVWYDPRGREMSPAAWSEDTSVVGMRISATVVDERTGLTDPHEHDVLVALFNAGPIEIGFVLPKAEGTWVALFDTSDETSQAALAPRQFVGGDRYLLQPRSVVLLRAEPPPTAPPEPPVARLRNRPRRRAADFRREEKARGRGSAPGGADAGEGLHARFDLGPALEDQAAAPLLGALPELGHVGRDHPDQLHPVQHVTQLEPDRVRMQEAERLARAVEEPPENRGGVGPVCSGEPERVVDGVVSG